MPKLESSPWKCPRCGEVFDRRITYREVFIGEFIHCVASKNELSRKSSVNAFDFCGSDGGTVKVPKIEHEVLCEMCTDDFINFWNNIGAR